MSTENNVISRNALIKNIERANNKYFKYFNETLNELNVLYAGVDLEASRGEGMTS